MVGKTRIQHREVAGTNFRISGVDLAGDGDEDALLQAAKILGKSPIEFGGDASTSNQETCYRAAAKGDNTYLIFGRGEVEFLVHARFGRLCAERKSCLHKFRKNHARTGN